MKAKYWIIISVVLVILIVVVILWYRSYKRKSVEKALTQNPAGNGSTASGFSVLACSAAALNVNRLLAKGDVNCEVADLQLWLNKYISNPILKLTVDGNFGTNTETQLKNITGYTQGTLSFLKGTKPGFTGGSGSTGGW
jgi:hypothetical protein